MSLPLSDREPVRGGPCLSDSPPNSGRPAPPRGRSERLAEERARKSTTVSRPRCVTPGRWLPLSGPHLPRQGEKRHLHLRHVPALEQVVGLEQVHGVHAVADHGLDEVGQVFQLRGGGRRAVRGPPSRPTCQMAGSLPPTPARPAGPLTWCQFCMERLILGTEPGCSLFMSLGDGVGVGWGGHGTSRQFRGTSGATTLISATRIPSTAPSCLTLWASVSPLAVPPSPAREHGPCRGCNGNRRARGQTERRDRRKRSQKELGTPRGRSFRRQAAGGDTTRDSPGVGGDAHGACTHVHRIIPSLRPFWKSGPMDRPVRPSIQPRSSASF